MGGYHFQWDVIWQYRAALGSALAKSLLLGAASIAVGTVCGLALAYAANAPWRTLCRACRLYIDAARNTPLLLLVFFLYLGLPQLGVRGIGRDLSFVMALSLVASAYLAETFRAALSSIPAAQLDAAKAIGLRAHQRQLYVVLPIALRYALPAVANIYIAVVKDTSVASVIAIQELTFVAREISTNYFRIVEAWAAVSLVYLALCGTMAMLARLVETRLPRLS